MKASVTYIHLLAKTPFFTKLTRKQLQWVIDHSEEWEAGKGDEIASSKGDPGSFWVLLDGGWQIETAGGNYKAGHAGPAKWYGSAAVHAASAASRLIATEHSYVMNIRLEDFKEMLKQGFDFEPHLQQGAQFYAEIFKSQAGR